MKRIRLITLLIICCFCAKTFAQHHMSFSRLSLYTRPHDSKYPWLSPLVSESNAHSPVKFFSVNHQHQLSAYFTTILDFADNNGFNSPGLDHLPYGEQIELGPINQQKMPYNTWVRQHDYNETLKFSHLGDPKALPKKESRTNEGGF
jgi:hypothetical protein